MSDDPIPYGYCQCGCGELTVIIPKTDTLRGYVKGESRKFRSGHNPAGRPYEPLESRYEVRDCGYATPCWCWIRNVRPAGYALITEQETNRTLQAHRFFYELYRGPIPEGLEPDHLCKNRGCVNPWHLELVTHTENVRRGSHTKLDFAKAQEIRARLKNGERRRELAVEFDVCPATISHIKNGRTWVKDDRQPERV